MRHEATATMRTAYNYYTKNKWSLPFSLNEVYRNYSSAKAQAYARCCRLMNEFSGEGLRIVGHNCDTFSVAFAGVINGKCAFFYITRTYDRYIYLDEV